MTTMLIAKRPPAGDFLTSSRKKTRWTLRSEADPAAMLQQYNTIRSAIGSNVEDRIKISLLVDEPARQDFLYKDGSLKYEELYGWLIEDVASLVPAQKADKVFRKWFGGTTEREKEIGFEVIYQMGHQDLQGPIVNYPSCLYRFSNMRPDDETLDADFTLTDAKELCRHWTPVMNVTIKEMTRMGHIIMEAFHDCQKHGRKSFIFDECL